MLQGLGDAPAFVYSAIPRHCVAGRALVIGVFDSGSGGLTILRELAATLPDRRFTYLGDHANAPCGDRPAEEVYQLTIGHVERLFDAGCRLVLLACNTASAVALRRLQRHWLPHAAPDRRVLGVLVPMVEAITRVPWQVQAPPSGSPTPPAIVGVFATRRTVESGAYPFEIGRRAPSVQVVQQACPDLVAAIEANADDAAIRAMINGHVGALLDRTPAGRLDSVVLGCTHYPLVAGGFAGALPAGLPILQQPEIVAQSLQAYLDRHRDVDARAVGEVRFLTTRAESQTDAVASRFFGRPVAFTTVA